MPQITSLRMSVSEIASAPPTVEFNITAKVDINQEDIDTGVGHHIHFCVYDTAQGMREVMLAANGAGQTVARSIPELARETLLRTSTHSIGPLNAPQTVTVQDTIGSPKPNAFANMTFRLIAHVVADNGPADGMTGLIYPT